MDKFKLGETVYHVCDTMQNPLLVLAEVQRIDANTSYIVTDNVNEKECIAAELSREKKVF